MSIALSLFARFPRELVCCILEFDSRFSVRDGKIREIYRLHKDDSRMTMLVRMMRERKLDLSWFDLEDYHNLRPKFVVSTNRYDVYVLCIFDAEYVRDDGETVFETARELLVIRGSKYLELVCEY